MIALSDCEKGRVYTLASRNLAFGVYDGKEGFAGLRTKFDYEYVFTEYHWDTSGAFGTARPLEATEHRAPEGMSLEDWDNEPLFNWLKGLPL